VRIEPDHKRPRWLSLIAGGLFYAGALLGMWIVLAGQPDIQDLVVGSAAAVIAVGAGYLVSERGTMVPSARAADLRRARSARCRSIRCRRIPGPTCAAGRRPGGRRC